MPVMNVPRLYQKHPMVRQDEEAIDDGELVDGEAAPAGPSFTEVVELIVKYTEFTSIYLLEVQAATVGQIAGNLTICQNNSILIYNNSIGVYGKYQSEQYDEAGNATYLILFSVDGIYTACYYMLFEYIVALQVYVDTALNINKLFYNFLHNAGSMYDLSEEMYFRISDFENQGDTVSFWARLGFISGQLFHNLFE